MSHVGEAELAAAVALSGLPGMSPRRLARSVDAGAAASWDRIRAGHGDVDPAVAERWRAASAAIDAEAVLARHREAGVSVVLRTDPAYPDALRIDHEAPAVLFVRGDLAALDRPRAAIVGARRCTHYGRDVARSLGAALARAGVAVVSGLAAGIDGAAHRGAVAARDGGMPVGPPVGVVGSGLDVVYPRRHHDLWDAVAEAGCLLSEAPLGAAPLAWRFPARNRILAALSDVLVVVEAHEASGTRHTVDAAIARGVTVLAVPGPVNSPASAGANRLLREGCAPACDADDVLTALRLETAGSGRSVRDVRPPPAAHDSAVLAAVDWTPTSLESVLLRTGMSPVAAASALSRLESAGWVTSEAGWWARSAG